MQAVSKIQLPHRPICSNKSVKQTSHSNISYVLHYSGEGLLLLRGIREPGNLARGHLLQSLVGPMSSTFWVMKEVIAVVP